MEAELVALVEQYPLVEGVGPLETFMDSASVNGVTIRLIGLATRFRDQCVTGAAASLSESPLLRAYMELVERLAIVDAMVIGKERFPVRERSGACRTYIAQEAVFPKSPEPVAWSWARSNGVAVGLDWDDATSRARLELIERDSVLRSWYGEFPPEPMAIGNSLVPADLRAIYTFEGYTFGSIRSAEVVVGLFGFPRHEIEAPMLLGFAARTELRVAVRAAFSECLQQLGFLWGEALPAQLPTPSATADYHQDYFLLPANSERLRAWLRGENSRYMGILGSSRSVGEPRYVDLTPRHLSSRLCVAKAMPAGHVPLAFGSAHPLLRRNAPAEICVHPIA